MFTTVLVASVLAVSAQTDFYTDIDQQEDIILTNETALGEFLGAPCEETCSSMLINVYCKPETLRCECIKGYPVNIGISRGCAKPAQIGEQCYYFQTCIFTDQNAECVQISHNAVCQCKTGYHPVTVLRPLKRVFCTQDLVVITTDMPTLLGVATGLAIFTALICFVLKLFVGARPRHYANSNLSQPILFAQSGEYF
uniref:EB domain-containing protein n=1 Tax=Rhodnius prolixus TaxID=13249 RepID=T1HJW3_RHOPR